MGLGCRFLHLANLIGESRTERIQQYNQLLEDEKSGYRVIDGKVVPITSPTEFLAIETVINSPYVSVTAHMRKALSLYADLEKPDYENSIKESISAVEAMCCIINGKDTTLNKAIDKLKNNGIHIHPSLEKGFISIYGYACDEKGIRHAGRCFVNAPAEDAKYMLISCSAFVNYLMEK